MIRVSRTWIFSVVTALLFTLSLPQLQAQPGRIFWKDGTVTRIDSFNEISIRLVYDRWSRNASATDRGEYFTTLPTGELREVVFVRQQPDFLPGFSYEVRIRGFMAGGKKTELVIPTWDWLRMSTPGASDTLKTSVTFFHHQRRVPIDRIEFE